MLSFNDFKNMANNNNLKDYEKVGFADSHRGQNEENVFFDIKNKLKIEGKNKKIMDIGCGCSKPVRMLIEFARENDHTLYLVDSKEMLDNLPDESFIVKIPKEFPTDYDYSDFRGKIDYIVYYSVIHHVFYFSNMFNFIDQSLLLLNNGGCLLIGDIPNYSKKKRFLSSDKGVEFHQLWSGQNKCPDIKWNEAYKTDIGLDDAAIISILLRYRAMGCETYLLEQDDGLPINNTREDILIKKY